MKSKKNSPKELGIIGYGRFGRCAAHHLKEHFRVVVADVKLIRTAERGVTTGTIAEVAAAPIVILAVPINRMQAMLNTISPHLISGALVVDVCSVKEQPVRWMKNILPPHVALLGTHPLFGPDSAATSVTGKHIVVIPIRISKRRQKHIVAFLKKIKLRAVFMTPAAHDRLMATTLFVTQFIGRTTHALRLPSTSIRTKSYELLSELSSISQNDSTELFRDMYRYNRFARSVPKKFLSIAQAHSTLLRRNS